MSEGASMTLRAWAESFRELAEAGPDIADGVAQLMKADVDKAIGEGRSVDGQQWEPKKRGGGKPLANAAEAVSARGIGNVAVISLEGPEVFHHFGAGRNPERRILPRSLGGKLGLAIRDGVVTMCHEFMTRAGRHDRGGRGKKWKPKTGGIP